jgi:phospholipid-binding lipoprotein MlaA
LRPVPGGVGSGCVTVVAVVGLFLTGCGTVSPAHRVPTAVGSPLARTPIHPTGAALTVDAALAAPAAVAHEPAPPPLLTQAPPGPEGEEEVVDEEQYDPWEPFNEKMFDFNYRVDRYVLKPVAFVYRKIIPEPLEILIANGFDNIRWVPRFVNSLLQGKWGGAGREMGRFLINSTLGIGGLWDPAKDYWGIAGSREDFGQTLGVWGSGPGPYLVLPFLPPTTVRDGIGLGVDMFLDPLSYVLPFFPDRLGMRIGDTINERALNYELFQGVEETTLDLYSSVRHFYLERRKRQIRE